MNMFRGAVKTLCFVASTQFIGSCVSSMLISTASCAVFTGLVQSERVLYAFIMC